MKEDFLFDGQSLSGFGYMVCSFNSNSGTETSSVSEMNYTEIKAPKANISHKVSESYDNNLSRTIQIMKKNCNNEDNYNISDDELSEMTRWLCRKNYKWFKWVGNQEDNDIYFQVKINLRKVELLNNQIGLELDIMANASYGFTHEFTNTLSITTNNMPVLLNVYSDEEGFIYPDMSITIKENGDFNIVNTFENRSTFISNCKIGEIITITGGDTQQIISSLNSHDLGESFNYNFFRLCNLYRKTQNELIVNLKCEIVMKYRGIRKVGL